VSEARRLKRLLAVRDVEIDVMKDQFTREGLAIKVDKSIKAKDVACEYIIKT
jgi:hypothetical protein